MWCKLLKYYTGICLLWCCAAVAQAQVHTIAAIEKALESKNISAAASLVRAATAFYTKEKKADSLIPYIFYTGKVTQESSGTDAAKESIVSFLNDIKKLTTSPLTLCHAYGEASEYVSSVGDYVTAYQYNKEAYRYASNIKPRDNAALGKVESNMATCAQKTGDFKLAETHARRSLQMLLAVPDPDYESVYTSYNSMGAILWNASRTDSSLFYFNKALEALGKMPQNPRNRFYRPAIIYNNLAALYQMDGQTAQAIKATETTLTLLKNFIASKEPDTKKTSAVTFQFEVTDNLAGIYKELGDMRKAKELLEYSYRQKKLHLTENDAGIFISQILLGQIYYAIREHDKALQYLNMGLDHIAKTGGNYILWQADACNTLSLLYDAKHDIPQAGYYYRRTDSLYESVLQGNYDYIYLDFLRNEALFYAENNQPSLALSKALKGYDYIVRSEGASSLSAFYQLLNLSEICSASGNYRQSLAYSDKGLAVVNKKIASATNMLDSIKMELRKPKAILQKTKAAYALLENKNAAGLSALLAQINNALSIIERHKSILTNPDDENFVLADNMSVLEFAKKLNLELYHLTGDTQYLDRLISLHESGLYNKIRARLLKSDSLRFIDVPESTRIKEKQLRSDLAAALQQEGTHGERMQHYLKASQSWKLFIEQLRKESPRYYNIKYASFFKPLPDFRQSIPPLTTLVRYLFIDKKLFALVADQSQKKLYPLPIEGLQDTIAHFAELNSAANSYDGLLYELYNRLWAPLAKDIRYKKIIVIPDGILYNLNFEILTPQPIRSLNELATKSLLARYTFSYQYSLFLLQDQNKREDKGEKDFIAFAPGFSDQLKNNYLSGLKDSSQTDYNYLSLLPQPFSTRLALRLRDLFRGQAFVDEAASKNSFTSHAAGHKIIHIGTHAESNNLFPEFSRLIFAKNLSGTDEDNSLYVNEIYGCDLNTDLAVLTACETGRTGYQDGEGMISLAHAFYYAGSKSILTGLWKIDEHASTLIMNAFYENLARGEAKDEALRKAKLQYLEQANGRMLSPRYWGGLVIMGDISPVNITPYSGYTVWLVSFAILLLCIAAFLLWKRKKHTKHDL